jgi:hypothetical protein
MLAARYRIPAIYSFTFFAEAGGLMSYGINPLGEFQRAASRRSETQDANILRCGSNSTSENLNQRLTGRGWQEPAGRRG